MAQGMIEPLLMLFKYPQKLMVLVLLVAIILPIVTLLTQLLIRALILAHYLAPHTLPSYLGFQHHLHLSQQAHL
jgi:hypothetical protein